MHLKANTIVLAYNNFCMNALLQDMVIPFKDFRINVTISKVLAHNMDNTYKLLHECFAPALSDIELLPQYEDMTQYDTKIYEQINHAFETSFQLLLSRQNINLDFDSVDRKFVFDHAVKLAIDQAYLSQDFHYSQLHPFTFYQQLHGSWLIQGFNSNNYKLRPQKSLQLIPKEFQLFKTTVQVKKSLKLA